jgi:hypothetical protein
LNVGAIIEDYLIFKDFFTIFVEIIEIWARLKTLSNK